MVAPSTKTWTDLAWAGWGGGGGGGVGRAIFATLDFFFGGGLDIWPGKTGYKVGLHCIISSSSWIWKDGHLWWNALSSSQKMNEWKNELIMNE